ncbi:SAM-dependent methyltransferase [Actinoallomurus bryophytorum]|uniref:O-methyltransferase involved in polyketide biosynthesis n=1 Tax=Actinoallomurus bryophytorum TaxID=1490222 RepID=A0A543CHY4_9ACTN|nr:SAM-dependent methyltransferase [Actinoallomurus bryophytorum]TQL96714.1 O-methyltransferase involved in polyketide biosynthesis [Actinoallomurus bryophytorum]
MADTRASDAFHPQMPNEARIVDYLLGGKDNFAADREAAEQAIAVAPDLPVMAQESRKFLGRAVRFLAEEGIRQFIDIGCGLPTQNNAHEVAQAVAPDSHVMYVDIDPVVVSHARAILAGDMHTGVIQADMREPGKILAHPDLRRLIDLDRPVAILLLSALQAIPEDETAQYIVDHLRDAIVPGSWMVISHPVSDDRAEATGALAALFQDREIIKGSRRRANVRTRAEVEPYFEGLKVAAPGITPVPEWRSAPGESGVDAATGWSIVGVGQKP